jgi:putative ABC transport system permease protein
VITLALGIANSAIFTVVNAVLLRPLPYPDPDALLRVRHGTSHPDLLDWKEQTAASRRSLASGHRRSTIATVRRSGSMARW